LSQCETNPVSEALSSIGGNQLFRLGFNLRSEVGRSGPGAAAHHDGHFTAGVADEGVGEAVAPNDLGDGFLSDLVASGVFGGVDGLQLVVCVADEVVGEEDGWVGGRGLVFWVGFECPVILVSFGYSPLYLYMVGWVGMAPLLKDEGVRL
jgi:hypothetical protein